MFPDLRLIWRKGQSLQLLAMVSKEVTRKEEAMEHHKASVHHGMLLWVLHLVCIQLSNCKTTFNGSLLSTYSVIIIYGMKEVVSPQPTLQREILLEKVGSRVGERVSSTGTSQKAKTKNVCPILNCKVLTPSLFTTRCIAH